MTTFLYALIFLALALGGVIVRKTYNYKPLHELKRMAAKKDLVAVKLYPTAAYQSSLRALLVVYIAVTGATGIVLLARSTTTFVSIIVVPILLWAAFIWLPLSRTTAIGMKLTLAVNPAIMWLLGYLYPVLSRAAHLLHREHDHLAHPAAHTGVFERQDFIALIERQQHQPDNRLSYEELEIARRAMSFDDYTVSDIVTPLKKIKSVLAEEMLGPILIDELHKSDQNHVLVRESKKGPFVGTLDFKHLDLLHTGSVHEVMNPKVYYLHEQDALSDALHAFFITNHPVFIVVNSFEEYIGIITIENVLKQLLGHIPGDDFEQYANISAVAARHNKVKELLAEVENDSKVESESTSEASATDAKLLE
ncbi:MAG: CBS domain-containing protein [Patescibacteria group bacterium]|nr:CBS domain-containing protein [Patescibacteria group bacterium]